MCILRVPFSYTLFMNNQIIIIGAGASGLMLASLLPRNSATLIESNPKPGAKILISGGGKFLVVRCIFQRKLSYVKVSK